MWIQCNPNPARKEVPDCIVRAIAIALRKTWIEVYDDLCAMGRLEFSMPSDNDVWGKYLYELGFKPFLLPESCPKCVTVRKFSEIFYHGTYIIGTGFHAVTVIDGDYYDSWDSGNTVPTYFFVRDISFDPNRFTRRDPYVYY